MCYHHHIYIYIHISFFLGLISTVPVFSLSGRWDWAADSKEQLEEREIAYDQQGLWCEVFL